MCSNGLRLTKRRNTIAVQYDNQWIGWIGKHVEGWRVTEDQSLHPDLTSAVTHICAQRGIKPAISIPTAIVNMENQAEADRRYFERHDGN